VEIDLGQERGGDGHKKKASKKGAKKVKMPRVEFDMKAIKEIKKRRKRSKRKR
jgi:hypothetical protein